MKHRILVSSNGWEYSGEVFIEAEVVSFEWSSDGLFGPDSWGQEHADGNVLIADGVRIEFDEPFEYHGIVAKENK